MNSRITAIVIAVLVACLSASAIAGNKKTPKLYKWTDEKGVVHYGSSIPPQYAKQKSEIINSQGEVIKTIDAQKTPEEVAKEQKEKAAAEEKAKEEAKQVADQRAHDQVLLDTYVSVSDMERDRDSRISAIDYQINITNASISSLQSSLASYQKQADGYNKSNKPVPADLQQKLDDTQDELRTDQKLLLDQQQKKQAVRDQFTTDINRFKQLHAEQDEHAQQQNGG